MKTITVKDETWQQLTTKKAELMAGDIDSVIQYFLVKEKIQGEPSPMKHKGKASNSKSEVKK